MSNKRGRASEEEREFENEIITTGVVPLDITERPQPPIDFDSRERDEWYAIVNSMPSDWFSRPSLPMLTQYVRHTIASQNIAQLIANATSDPDEINVKNYIALLRAQKEESMVISSLATRLRISPQATINKRGNQKDLNKSKPWES